MFVMRRTIVILGLLALLVVPVGVAAQTAPIRCGPEAGPTPAPQCYSGPTAIEIVNPDSGMHFYPGGAFVQAGTTITWTNGHYETHTVTADDGSFASGPLEPGQQFSHTFAVAGGVTYHCDYHPSEEFSGSPLNPRVIVTN
jgi:plastocyanin